MQLPIVLGTVLQNRYRLIKILGQGGFGRTYLAEDQGRFNELCALKELIPAQTPTNVLEKAKELFQREASILYKIQHPQIPQFRATFEQDQRLFLVQDYVEGKTYAQLLDERKATGQTFSEAEVLQLIRQLLPVLAHLHSQGIIHRDISPDNIILRQRDRLPVLIDFGVVKQLATMLQLPNSIHQPTTVGKFGYSPSEQIQTGRAYPSSDLYALAVTSVVLLTSREPQELFDDTQLTWNWQRWAIVSLGLSRVLNRMLSYKPSDRYQSVAQVAQALPPLNNPTSPQLPPTPSHQHPNPALSWSPTVAVGHRPDLIEPNTSKPTQPDPVILAPRNRSVFDNPWAIAAIASCIAVLFGIGSWALVTSLRNNQQRRVVPPPQTFPSPVISESPTQTPTASSTPTPNTEPIKYSQRLNLRIGRRNTFEGDLKANTIIDYTFRAEQGQQLTATLAKEGVLLSVLGPNQDPLDDSAKRVTRYQGTLPFSGDYTIELSPVQGVTESNYRLNLRLQNSVQPTSTPTPTPAPTDTSTPTPTSSETPTPSSSDTSVTTPTSSTTPVPTPTPSFNSTSGNFPVSR